MKTTGNIITYNIKNARWENKKGDTKSAIALYKFNTVEATGDIVAILQLAALTADLFFQISTMKIADFFNLAARPRVSLFHRRRDVAR